MEYYLDNAATTKCMDEVVKKMTDCLLEEYGNPSSKHMMGVKAENEIKTARKTIADSLNVKEKEIFFTSGGTESNNLAIIGSVNANRRIGHHIITSPIEHSSVAKPIKYLEDQGYEISYIPVDENGLVILDELYNMISQDTVLVSIMHVNNEVGTIQPIEEIGQIIRQKSQGCIYHVDAVQAYGKIPINPYKAQINLLSASGHKFHGPKGSGFLFVKERTKLSPLVLGGGQELDLRSGTENVPAIAGLGVAASVMCKNLDSNYKKMEALKDEFLEKVLSIEDVHLNGLTGKHSASHIINISVNGVGSEVLLHALEDKGIYVSAGSACSSHKKQKSSTLSAMGLSDKRIDSAIRISICENTTREGLDACFKAIKELAPTLRKYQRR